MAKPAGVATIIIDGTQSQALLIKDNAALGTIRFPVISGGLFRSEHTIEIKFDPPVKPVEDPENYGRPK